MSVGTIKSATYRPADALDAYAKAAKFEQKTKVQNNSTGTAVYYYLYMFQVQVAGTGTGQGGLFHSRPYAQ